MSQDGNRSIASSWIDYLELKLIQVSGYWIQMLYLEKWRAKGVTLVLVVDLTSL